MRLIELSANKSSFKTIRFNKNGLTLICGSKSNGSSGNGVGKTLALGLVHHCLGANVQPLLKEKISDWVFTLRFELNRQEYCVQRSGDGKTLLLNDNKIGLTPYRDWLNRCGAFALSEKKDFLTFRSLIIRFARYLKEDCNDPIKTYKEEDVQALLRTFFLLGLDYDLINNKLTNKKRLDNLKTTIKNWKSDPVLHELFRAGHEPKLRLEWLETEIPRLENDLKHFDVAENYHDLVLDVQYKTNQLRELEKEINTIKFQLDGIEKLLQQKPDISRNDLLQLYNGLENIFKSDILVHFEAVESFHQTFFSNRIKRLENDRAELTKKSLQKEKERELLGKSRDDLLKYLDGKRALDEYTALSNKLATFKAERTKLEDYLTFVDKRKEELQQVKEDMLHEDSLATEYVKMNPHEKHNAFFKEIATKLYPRLTSGITFDNNTGDNQLRYQFKVQIEGDGSDGIGDARTLCFDWLLLMRGQNHNIDFLWHDNRLFADMGEIPRAAWFKKMLHSNIDKQYIASINIENYESMKNYLDEADKQALDNAIKLKLYDDKPENKLLGIQFG
jgi:uncharacterized protein YydD (DUF2326 family)